MSKKRIRPNLDTRGMYRDVYTTSNVACLQCCCLQDLAMGDEPRPLEDLQDDTLSETEGIDAHGATIVSSCGAV
jgi:hypothetical protein